MDNNDKIKEAFEKWLEIPESAAEAKFIEMNGFQLEPYMPLGFHGGYTSRDEEVEQLKKALVYMTDFLLVSDKTIGKWLSAALEDPAVCKEFKDDINTWFEKMEESALRMPIENIREMLKADGIDPKPLVDIAHQLIERMKG